MSTLEVNKITPSTGTSITLGDSGDTFTIPSGVSITNNGTQTGFGGVNTPSFLAYLGSSQTVNSQTGTILQINTEVFDTDSCFNTTNYRFTPTTSGKYYIFASQRYTATDNYDTYMDIQILKNGSDYLSAFRSSNTFQETRVCSTIESFNGSSDYVQVRVYQNSNVNLTCEAGRLYTYFGGYRIIE